MRFRLLAAIAILVAVASALTWGPPATATAHVGVPAGVPGPAWLHRPLATTPILENVGGWRAAPLLVSGADAHVDGEFVSQDFIYDAYGANSTDVPMAPPDTSPSSTSGLASAPTGDIAQPLGARFGRNAGDLLEFRAREVDGGVAYRVTLNTILDAAANAVAIGIDTDSDPTTGTDDWGAGIGTLGELGLEHVVVVSGSDAFADGDRVPVQVSVDRNQIDVELSVSPGDATWRHYVVAGISDGMGHFAPILDEPDADHAGGAHGTDAPPVLNVGFRRADQEPMGVDTAETGGRGAYGYGSWRDHAQAKALAARDISAFFADVAFADLRPGVTRSTVPTSGFMDRLYVSHLTLGEGVQPAAAAGGSDVLLGQVQPYSLYVPEDLDTSEPAPFTLLLHAAACNYNQYGVQAPQLHRLLGDDRGGVIATPQARGQTVGYSGLGEVDTFEVWADVASRYALDFDRVALSGISMGGIGSFRLASLYPDLFSRVFPIAGHGQAVIDIAENLRNVPLMMWNGVPDELVRADQYLPYQRRLEELGYRHEQDLFPATDHLVHPLGSGTDFSRGAAFLGLEPIDRNPRRVTYRVVPTMANDDLELEYDGAYWVDNIVVAEGAARGTVDAVDRAAPDGEPVATVFTRPGSDPEPHVARGVEWTPSPAIPANAIELLLVDVVAVTVDVGRTDVDVARTWTATIDTTTQSTLTLDGVGPGSLVLVDGVVIGRTTTSSVTVDLGPGDHVVTITR